MIDQQRKIRLAAVSYLNTKPLLAGLKSSRLLNQLEIVEATPGECSELLQSGRADIALIPVATIPNIPDARIISNYCIGATGKVGSVCLFSEVPIDQIESVLLDYQSRTSVKLCQILFQKYWGREVNFEQTQAGYIDEIRGTTAGVVIGDRTFSLHSKMPYCYDLSEAWMTYSGLPFVFANWVSRVPLSDQFLIAFDQAMQTGLEHKTKLANELQSDYRDQNVLKYFTDKIDYEFNETKRLGLQQFFRDMNLTFQPSFHYPQEKVQP